MANTPAAQIVVLIEGAAPIVSVLLGGASLGAQDGADLGTGGAAVAQAEAAAHAGTIAFNRAVEFRDDRYALTASTAGGLNQSGCYRRGQGGVEQWGLVSEAGDEALQVGATSGLFVLHPNGVPTLCYLKNTTGNRIMAFSTTDGVSGSNWISTGVIAATGATVLQAGQAIAFKSSIVWSHIRHSDSAGNGCITQFDFSTGLLTRYDPVALFDAVNPGCSYGLHVHDSVLFVFGWTPGTAGYSVAKLAGSFAAVQTATNQFGEAAAGNTGAYGHSAMFTDPATGDLIVFMSGDTNGGGGIPGVRVGRIQNATGGSPSFSEIQATVLGAVEGADKYAAGGGAASEIRRFSVFVDIVTAPGTVRTFIYTWLPGGTTECWEWKGIGAEIESVGAGAGISDNYAIPYVTAGGGHRTPSTARISIGDIANPPAEVSGGTQIFFRAAGADTAKTLQFRGSDNQGAPTTIVPIVAASLTLTKPLLDLDLEVYYKFNDNGDDSSPNLRHLTYSGAEAYATGRFGNGYSLAGVDGVHAETSPTDLTALELVGHYTISAWINLTSLATRSVICEKYSNPGGWTLYVEPTGEVEFVYNGTGIVLTPTGDITAATLQHVMVVADGDTIKIFVDGVERASTAFVANAATATPFWIGDSVSQVAPFNGVIDELAIWTRALGATERGYVYNSGAGFELEGLTPYAAGQPSISANTVINLTPDGGRTLYSVILDTASAGIDEGDTGLLIAELA
jgi:hypothetical protein